MSAPALLIVDVQRGFITPDTAHIPRIVEVLQADYERVYVTRFINADPSPYRRLRSWHRFSEGSDDVELAFTPRADAWVIDKHRYSAVSPALLSDLRRHAIEEVDICGIATDACVLLTAVELFEADLRGLVLESATASHHGPTLHRYGLELARRLAARGEDHASSPPH